MVDLILIGIDAEKVQMSVKPLRGFTDRPSIEARTWMFQANPNKYDIFQTLKSGEELWNLRQHAKDVHVGDRVLIWVCGDDAGIYAVGRVISPAVTMPDSPEGIKHWSNPAEGKRPTPRVLVRYERLLLERPLRKAYLQSDPNLWSMKILCFPQGTNFAVSAAEWQALSAWLE